MRATEQKSEDRGQMSEKPKCKFCVVRAPVADKWRDDELSGYCDICRQASRIAHTSIDDAMNSIHIETCVDVIYMAAKMEKEGSQRISMMKMLRSRLSKLIGIRKPQLYPGEAV